MSEIKKSDIEKKAADELASFMKNRKAKRAKQAAFGKSASNADRDSQQDISVKKEPKKDLKKDKKNKEIDEVIDEEEEVTTEEKELEEAKKTSLSKAAEHDQTEMYKRLLKETFYRYFMIFAISAILAAAVVRLGPAVVSFFNGAISRAFISALGQ